MEISGSLNQILSEKKLITERFYTEKLFKVYPEFIPYFSDTNMKVQAMMLMMALQGMVWFTGGYYPPAVVQYFRFLGTRHRKQGVPHEFFSRFCEMLLTTVAEFHGGAWDEELAGQWRLALAKVTTTMLEGYKEDFDV